jgi:hypothetical protein
MCAIYAKYHGLATGYRWMEKLLQSREESQEDATYGEPVQATVLQDLQEVHVRFEIPRTYDDAIRLDKLHGNNKWQGATKLEMDHLHEYNTFHDKDIGTTPGEKFKKIRVHLVYACKHDGHHKARLCGNGNLTDTDKQRLLRSCLFEDFAHGNIPCRTQWS